MLLLISLAVPLAALKARALSALDKEDFEAMARDVDLALGLKHAQ